MSILNAPHFHDEAAAFAELESILWPDGPFCPHCGTDRIYVLKGVRSKPSKKHPEGVERHGLKKCGTCRKQFTVRVGTVFEDSHAPLHKWFQAIHLMCSSKKGISSHQLHRILEVQYNTAWFMSHRIREAMRVGGLMRNAAGLRLVPKGEPPPKFHSGPQNTQFILLGIGHLIFAVFTSQTAGLVDFPPQYRHIIRRIHPHESEIIWPPLEVLSDIAINDSLALVFNNYLDSIEWVPGS